jgi:hypothetical protein
MARTMRNLKLSVWHLAIWLALAMVTAALAVQVCLRYNTAAGTDLTRAHIVWIGISVLFGPLVGPMANPQAGETVRAAGWTAAFAALVFASLSPFILRRRPVTTGIAVLCWLGFFGAACLWFASALVSLGFFLS